MSPASYPADLAAEGAPKATGPPQRRRLGEMLIDEGVLTAEQLQHVLATQTSATGKRRRLGEMIVELGLADEVEIAQALSNQLRIPFVRLERLMAAPDHLLQLIPRQVAVRHEVIPVAQDGEALTVAMADPTNVVVMDDLRLLSRVGQIRPAVALPSELNAAVNRRYRTTDASSQVLQSLGDFDSVQTDTTLDVEQDTEDEADATMAPVVRLVNAILGEALHNRASDIHIEPQAHEVRVRMRIDGLLRQTTVVPKHVQGSLTSRIKILSGMDIAQRRKPQDGRGQVRTAGMEADTRVSTMPTMHGEKIVIRLLRKERKQPRSLALLGLEANDHAVLAAAVSQPQGLILLTGPTGSGKTTTLYATLHEIQRPDINVITLEDPVEYQMQGINQMQVDERIGLTFAAGLRAALRQDPDVILVGEIRDPETAAIAMRASMTGHLVFSTLHTNDAPSAVTRMVDMGVEPFLITSSVSLVVAQRLARTPCDNCARPAEPDPENLVRLGIDPAALADAHLRVGAGCSTCAGSGYLGRKAVFEVMRVTKAVRDLVVAQAPDGTVRAQALADGMRSLRTNALAMAMRGETTLEEILRVTPSDGELGMTTTPAAAVPD